MLATVSLIILSGCASLGARQEPDLVAMQAEIEIEAPINEVFAFAADISNDHFWRAEVVEIAADGPLRVGASITEIAALGLVFRYRTVARVTKFSRPKILRVESPPGYSRQFMSTRKFVAMGANRTSMTYIVAADIRMIGDIWPLPVHPDVAKAFYEARMRGYLARLKLILEARVAATHS